MKLSPVQKEIVETSGNLIVRASAGTGKTFTMVNKIAKEIDDNHTHKVIAAITFTIKAAQEIKDRLSVDISQHFIGTNNSFVIEEVIKPFMKDVYGADFDLDMSTDYSVKVNTFQEGIDKVRNEGILCSYKDNKNNFILVDEDKPKEKKWKKIVKILLVVAIVCSFAMNGYVFYNMMSSSSDSTTTVTNKGTVKQVNYDVKTDTTSVVEKASDSVVGVVVYKNTTNNAFGFGDNSS